MSAAAHPQDTLIRGGRVIDGSGNPWFYADVVLSGGKVTAIAPPGRIDVTTVAHVVDADGLVVAPGFIDIQSHSIVPLMRDGRCLSKIKQGVTTEIMGEGWTPAPFGGRIPEPVSRTLVTGSNDEWTERARSWSRFGQWLRAFEEHGVSPNVGSFLGGGTLREYAKGLDMGPAEADELDTLRRVMAESMEDGAFGVSFALIYPPDAYVETAELVEVCKVVAAHQGVYITHIRSESDQFLEALEEAIQIGQQADCAVEIYHLKAAGPGNWPKMPQAIARIDAARAAGLDITADMYPYVASGTGLSIVLPPWSAEGGLFFDNLRDPAMRAKIREAAMNPDGTWEAAAQEEGPESIMPVGMRLPEHQQYIGKRLTEIAEERGQEWIDTAIDLMAAEESHIFTMFFGMSEENLELQLQQPWIKVSSDAGGLDPAWAKEQGPTHPRAYGTFPRVLGHYVRDRGVLPLEDAVRKMTSSVAQRLNMTDRGLLREGLAADVVIFDPATINDVTTYDETHQLAVGVRDVWVNGVRVLEDGEHTGATPGRFVKPAGA